MFRAVANAAAELRRALRPFAEHGRGVVDRSPLGLVAPSARETNALRVRLLGRLDEFASIELGVEWPEQLDRVGRLLEVLEQAARADVGTSGAPPRLLARRWVLLCADEWQRGAGSAPSASEGGAFWSRLHAFQSGPLMAPDLRDRAAAGFDLVRDTVRAWRAREAAGFDIASELRDWGLL